MSGREKGAAARAALMGLLLGLTLVLGWAETLVPVPLPVEGIRWGFANVAVLICLFTVGKREALLLSVCKSALTGLLFSGLMSVIYSMSGGLVSLGTMLLLSRGKRLGLVGISAAGAAAHNIGQVAAAMAVLGSTAVLAYLPPLLLTGTLSGIITGLLASAAIHGIEKTGLLRGGGK